jgi:hypothetical protein
MPHFVKYVEFPGRLVCYWLGFGLLLHGASSQYQLDKEQYAQSNEDEHLPELIGYESQSNAEEHATQVELHLTVGTVELCAEFAVVFPG